MERIEKASIEYKGQVCTGWRHCYIGIEMVKRGVCPRPYPYETQGFMTSTGRHVTREEAYDIAVKAGQVVAGETHKDGYLFSEDVWDVNGVPLI